MGLLHLTFCLAVSILSTKGVIDDVFRTLEEEYEDAMLTEETGRSALQIPAWNDYHMDERSEKFILLNYDTVILEETWRLGFYRGGAKTTKRNAVADQEKLWETRTIPYRIHEEFPKNDIPIILEAMQEWSKFTCITFVPAKDSDLDMVIFKRDFWNKRCESYVGRLRGVQALYLAKKCMTVEIVMHEIGHLLGLYHEHSRYDRDEYVTINYEHVNATMHLQFDQIRPQEMNLYNKPYDYYSIMHYSNSSFAMKRGDLTIVPNDTSFLPIIGQVKRASFLDIQIVNDMYTCSAGCVKLQCPVGAFQGKNCECYCQGDEPGDVIRCDENDYCDAPELDTNVFHVYVIQTALGDIGELRGALHLRYPHGTELLLVFTDVRCQPESTYIKCENKKWNDTAPVCEKVGCVVDSSWWEFYGSPTPWKLDLNTLPSGDELELYCKTDVRKKTTLTCIDAEWENKDTLPHCVGESCIIEVDEKKNVVLIDESFRNVTTGHPIYDTRKLIAICRDANVAVASEGTQMTTLTCDDGTLRGDLPTECQKDVYQCPTVLYSTTSGPVDKSFTIRCMDGYEMSGMPNGQSAVDTFTCDQGAQWKPFVPRCIPAGCVINYDASNDNIAYNNGTRVLPGTKIVSGSDVTITCKHGYYPAEMVFSCDYGKVTSETEDRLISCRQVTCAAPNLSDMRSDVQNSVYVYNDVIKINRCNGLKKLEGNNKIICQKDGTWSDTPKCVTFCLGRGQKIASHKHTRLTWGKRIKSAYSYADCERQCKYWHRVLCLAFSYGIGKNGNPDCRITRHEIDKNPEKWLTQEDYFTLGVRECE